MKTLNTIQKLSKIGKVLSKIVFIFCIVGFCGCIVGILSMALGAPTLKIGGVTLESILNTEAEVTIGTVYAAMTTGMILCAGEAVLGKLCLRNLQSITSSESLPMVRRSVLAVQKKCSALAS